MTEVTPTKSGLLARALASAARKRESLNIDRRRDALSSPGKSRKPGHRVRNAFIALLVILALIAVAGFLVVPPVAKRVLVTQLSEKLHRQVSIGDIAFNPFSLTLSIKGFAVSERNSSQEFVGFDELFVNLQLESLLRRGPVFREIRVERPRAHLVRIDEKTFNFSDLLHEFAGNPVAEPQKPSPPPRFSLNNIQIHDGSVTLDDQLKGSQHNLTKFVLSIPFISNLDYTVDDPVMPGISGAIDGAVFEAKGSSKPFKHSQETTIRLDVDGLQLPKYLEYLPRALNFKVPSMSLTTRLALSFVRAEDRAPQVNISGRISLNDVALTHLDGRPAVSLKSLEVDIASADPLNQRASIAAIVLKKPELHVQRQRDGSISLMELKGPGSATDRPSEQSKGASEGKLDFSLAELRLEGGIIHFADAKVAGGFAVDISPLDLKLSKLHIPQKDPAGLELSLQTSIGASLQHQGHFLLEPLVAVGKINLQQVDIARLFVYYQDLARLEVPQGILSLSTAYALSKDAQDMNIRLSGVDATLNGLKVRAQGKSADFFQLGRFAAHDGQLDLRAKTVSLGGMELSDGMLQASRDRRGVIDLSQLSPPGNGRSEAPPTPAPTTSIPSTPWTWSLGKFALTRFKATFRDEYPATPVTHTLEPIAFAAENLSSKINSTGKINLAMGLNKSGKIGLDGTLGLNPLAANIKFDIRTINLVPLQPYFAEKLNILISSGALSSKGSLGYRSANGKSGPVTVNADVGLSNFASVDKVASEDMLKWKSLYVSSMKAVTEPFALDIAEVALTDFYSRLIIFPDGHLNVQDIAGTQTTPVESAPKSAVTPAPSSQAAESGEVAKKITIGKLTLQGGNINFSDRFIKPNYSANLTDIGGSVTGLSSQLGTTATLEIRGNLDKTAPLEITGRVNPLIKNLLLDIKAQVKDIELGPMSPYSGKYVGYAIEKGKMSFEVKYNIENRKLKAENRLVVDQLTFGDKVESKDALSLPVKFAISLLKDKDGVIDINLPVSGSLDDPKFSIGGLIWKVIVNLFQKAVTSPFALIGSMFGGGPELSQIDFAAGSAILSKESQDRLGKLAKALTDRPGLKLDITGRLDAAADREGLRKMRFDRMVKAEKLKDMVKRGESAPSVDQVNLESAEYEKYLTRAYRDAKFPKPRNVIGLLKDLPRDEMEKLMLTSVAITDDDLQKLATERAQAAKDFLTKTSQIATERVFLTASKASGGNGQAGKASGSRAEFALK